MILHGYTEEIKENMRGGTGAVTIRHWVSGDAVPKGLRLAGTLVIPPGASIGVHKHEGEAEVFNVLYGEGDYDDNGQTYKVRAHDVMVCHSGQSHGVVNLGAVPLVIDAIIVKE